jgi:hypothetical protein
MAAKPDTDKRSDARDSAHDKTDDDGAAKNELVFELVKKDGGFAIQIGTREAGVLLAMLAAGAKAP